MSKIRVFIADDHAMVRMGLATLLGSKKDISVVGEAEDGETTVRKVLETKPDVVLMDLMMPDVDGAEATARLHQALPDLKIVILTSADTTDGISRALSNGAVGALTKGEDFSTLVDVIRDIAAGKTCISPEIRRMLDQDPPAPALTRRQQEILRMAMQGFSYSDMSRHFGIREDSVRRHIAETCAKLGAANRLEAVAIALRKHLLKI